MKTVAFAIAIIGACLAASGSPARAAGLECPRLEELDTPAVPAEVDRLGAKGLMLEQPAELQAAAAFLREQGLSSDDAINHLIAFYCPAVAAEAGLSDDEKANFVGNCIALAPDTVFMSARADTALTAAHREHLRSAAHYEDLLITDMTEELSAVDKLRECNAARQIGA